MTFYIGLTDNIVSEIDIAEMNDYSLKIDALNPEELISKLDKYEMSDELYARIDEFFNKDTGAESLLSYNIKHWVSNRSFGELIDMYENGEIRKPEMQREFVWDAQKSSRLIESILIGLPIPPLFFLEVGKNEYEVIDGYQRLVTVTNYVTGKPWVDNPNTIRKAKAKLSGNISEDLKGKSFDDLTADQQRIIKRSTIPLVEFRQINPENSDSKYMIFERLNSGSEKLNSMQIRKSLAYGPFIKSLYEQANKCDELRKLYSVAMQKKDAHVEALLRVYAMSDIYYNKEKCDKNGLNNILNSFCEEHKKDEITPDFAIKVDRAITELKQIFPEKNLFKRVVIDTTGKALYTGNFNVCILEAMVGVYIRKLDAQETVNKEMLRGRYEKKMDELVKRAIENAEENPFSTSTGTKEAIIRRFQICEEIIG
ncbi:Protein of unknown function DUF262 [Pseudobutyrivibrio sp. OR37]|uniref:DUF262 domain-containing protein n=1 Tax=Pseudobutyrivibrio sp. OR37 TaxID=1798186 RepID=UPI0008EC1FD2|nr:DUF262 domain-containing protein [Pseudobutyrivibrio sp. OR37]SFI24468.1 Protein of unknown function DUF262 [Pseudobutyrivibrio sp. OR37]